MTTVHLARARLGDLADLDPTQRRRVLRYEQEADRARCATGVRLVLHALRRATGDEAATVERRCIGCGAADHGPVEPAGRYAGRWSLSVTHSGDVVGVAVRAGAEPVGLDLEAGAARSLDAVARLVCTPYEQAADAAAPDTDDALRIRWVRKEAVLKAARVGLTVPMTHLELSAAHEPPRVLGWDSASRPDGLAAADIALCDLALQEPAGVRGAVAVLGTADLDARCVRVEDAELVAGP
ncbi:4'-phosphopantetheinyl transferase family protein [Luteipulveratus flavus]|uniref:4'-phosphopantetheinyl transferase superfamily protein n=1 Tax=Luteipulveratus flavus TaxID=3031728 RepID=A0ABT6C6Q8_9MICO|nr:4'-phosphopantetheinyl transferase superfamily protein [Luteipulveratus sp. YIM 133296]MDF8264575.1 4'-phosphopantetheinyl transferase superfamily protein [Luteipulveratus sp. YIM 133296]